VKKIRKGSPKDKDSKNIAVQEQTLFYLYIIWDPTSNMSEYAELANSNRTP